MMTCISHQLRYINTVSWIGGNVAVHMRKVDNLRIMVVVVERFIFIATK